jgi:hypothetical protein
MGRMGFLSVFDVQDRVIGSEGVGAACPYCGGPVLAWDYDSHLLFCFLANFPQNQEKVLLHYLRQALNSSSLISPFFLFLYMVFVHFLYLALQIYSLVLK